MKSVTWNQALISDNPQKLPKTVPSNLNQGFRVTRTKPENKGIKAKGNMSPVRVIVQRRACVLQTHHCKSASHWSSGLKSQAFSIYANSAPFFIFFIFFIFLFIFFYLLVSSELGKLNIALLCLLSIIFSVSSHMQCRNTCISFIFLCLCVAAHFKDVNMEFPA